jgi:hypothetical protein
MALFVTRKSTTSWVFFMSYGGDYFLSCITQTKFCPLIFALWSSRFGFFLISPCSLRARFRGPCDFLLVADDPARAPSRVRWHTFMIHTDSDRSQTARKSPLLCGASHLRTDSHPAYSPNLARQNLFLFEAHRPSADCV